MNKQVQKTHLKELQQLIVSGKQGIISRSKKHKHLAESWKQYDEIAREYAKLTGLEETKIDSMLPRLKQTLVMNNVTCIEELHTFIGKCIYCNERLRSPYRTPGTPALKLRDCCFSKECETKFNAKKKTEGVIAKYGTDNVSKLEWVKKKKEETSLKRFGVKCHTQLESQKQKIREIIRKKYGVDNVSQLESVKEKKKQTFLKNFGVDNIFRRVDLLEKKWASGINGVEEYKYILQHKKNYPAFFDKVYGQSYCFFSPYEKIAVQNIIDILDPVDLRVNDHILYRLDLEDEDPTIYCWSPDIYINDLISIDIKQNVETFKSNDIKKGLLHSLNNGKFYCYICVGENTKFSAAYFVNPFTEKVNTYFCGNKRSIESHWIRIEFPGNLLHNKMEIISEKHNWKKLLEHVLFELDSEIAQLNYEDSTSGIHICFDKKYIKYGTFVKYGGLYISTKKLLPVFYSNEILDPSFWKFQFARNLKILNNERFTFINNRFPLYIQDNKTDTTIKVPPRLSTRKQTISILIKHMYNNVYKPQNISIENLLTLRRELNERKKCPN